VAHFATRSSLGAKSAKSNLMPAARAVALVWWSHRDEQTPLTAECFSPERIATS
jgi:hypothetical protein